MWGFFFFLESMLVERDSFGGTKSTRQMYSICSKYLLYATTTGFLVYSSGGQLLHKVDLVGCNSLQMNPKNHMQVYCSTKEYLYLYDFTLGIQIQNWHFPTEDIDRFYIHDSKIYLLTKTTISREKEQKELKTQVTVVKQLNLAKKELRPIFKIENQLIKSLHFIKKKCIVILSHSVNFFYLADLLTGDIEKVLTKYAITACTAHSEKEMAAIGDINGRIMLWFDVLKASRTSSILHWHAYKVFDLAFTRDASYLLSGGNEATVVIWQLETGQKQFLPRLGGEIHHIELSPDETQYSMFLSNNSILLVSSADVSQRKSIDGIHQAGLEYSMYPPSVGLQVDPKTGNLCMNGSPSELQFLNPQTGQTTMQLLLAEGQRITFGKDVTVQPHITQSAFSENGDWLVTVDERPTSHGKVSYLKFWEFDPEIQEYRLNTRVDTPHQLSITDIAVCPWNTQGPLICATASLDGKFKIWELVEPKRADIGKHWKCRSISEFKNYQANSVAFSSDGSLLAVGFENVITLWDPLECCLKKTLVIPGNRQSEKRSNILFVDFYLVVWTKNVMHVWSLLSCSSKLILTLVMWSLKAKVQSVEKDPYSMSFACAVIQEQKGCIFIFEPTSPIPLQTLAMDCKPYGIVYLKSSTGNAPLVYLDKNFELHRFTVEEEPKPKFSLPKLEQSLFTSMYGKTINQDGTSVTHMERIDPDTLQFLDIPAHILPTPCKIADKFLEGFLKKRWVPKAEPYRSTTTVEEDDEMESIAEPPPITELSAIDQALRSLFVSVDSTNDEQIDKELVIAKPRVMTERKRDRKSPLVERNLKGLDHVPITSSTSDSKVPSTITKSKAPKTPTSKNSKKRSVPNT
jgi:WD40 repeat protein